MQGIQFDWLRELFPDLPPSVEACWALQRQDPTPPFPNDSCLQDACPLVFRQPRHQPNSPPASAPTTCDSASTTSFCSGLSLEGSPPVNVLVSTFAANSPPAADNAPVPALPPLASASSAPRSHATAIAESHWDRCRGSGQLAADEVSGIGRQCIGRDLTSALSRHTTHQRRRHCVQCTVVLIEAPHFPAPLFAWLFAAATLLRTGTRFHRPQSQGRVDLQHSSNPRPDQHVEGTHGQPDEKHDASAPGSPPKPKGRTGPDLYPSARREGTLEREPRQQGTDWCSYNMTSFEPRKKFIHKHNPGHTEDEAQHGGYGANQRCENCSLRKAAYPRTQRNAYE